jgi:hypothetical protein
MYFGVGLISKYVVRFCGGSVALENSRTGLRHDGRRWRGICRMTDQGNDTALSYRTLHV